MAAKKTETDNQNLMRVLWSTKGGRLFRNNVGVLKNSQGGWVRYGLANESKQMNQNIKSGDCIGWYPLEITPEMVGKTVAVFCSVEVKKEGYKPSGKRQLEHHEAQSRWADMVNQYGGFSGIFDSVGSLEESFNMWLNNLES